MEDKWDRLDISTLWDFNNPALSEERFRAALAGASEDETLLLQTQIARTYGIRRDFARAQQILFDMEPQIEGASAETRVRYYLELGRTYCSATHAPESQTAEVKEGARAAFERAFDLAKEAELDSLAIDALHMMTFVDTAPEEQAKWNRKAIALMQASSQPDAIKWEASLYNNLGYALHLLTKYEEALEEFKKALAAQERGGNAQAIRVAHWMIAWTLRAMGRLKEALEIQLRLKRECDDVGEPDPYVLEEIELLENAIKTTGKP